MVSIFKFKKSKYKKVDSGKGIRITGKKFIGRDKDGSYVVVGRDGVKASYSPELLKKAEAHLKRLK